MDEKTTEFSPSPEEMAPVEEAVEAVETEKTEKPKGKLALWLEKTGAGPWPLVLSFLLPFLIFGICLAVLGVYPAGNEQIINYDGWHQYYPFVMRLWEHFKEGTSLLYDWGMGMGTNFLSMLSYYGASPFNLLLIFVPVRDFRLLFMLFTVIRIGLAGLFMGLFLKKLIKPSWTVPFFALGYALSGYLMGYYWNNMWLDTVALLPLVMLGLVKLFREGRSSLYIITLAVSLFANYYIGWMVCIFCVMVFFALCVLDKVRWSDFWRKGLRFGVGSLLGGGLSAVMLLPAFFGLLNTVSTTDPVRMYVSFYESVMDLVAALTAFREPAVMDGLPNLATAAVLALFAFAFLWAKRIGFREKLVSFFFLLFLVFSMNFSVPNYFWHGMHYTNMIPYRFAFLFAFTVVVMAYVYFCRGLEGFDWIDGLGMLLFAGVVCFCAWRTFTSETVLVTAVLFSIGVVLCVLVAARLLPRGVTSAVLCAVLLFEGTAAAYFGTQAVGTTAYAEYFGDKKGEEISALVQRIEEKEGDSVDFGRTEVTQWRSLNDSCFYHYDGISQFASSANVNVATFLKELGMPADPGSNRFVYVHGTPLANTLLGVKYLIEQEGYLSDRDLICLSASSTEFVSALYEVQGFAGLGFLTEKGAGEFEFDPLSDPFEKQNALFRALTGLEGELFTKISPVEESHTNLDVGLVEGGLYYYAGDVVPEEEDPGRIFHFRYTAPVKGNVYVYADFPTSDYAQINNAYHNISEYPNLFSAGFFMENESFHLRAFPDEPNDGFFEGNFTLYVCVFNEALWQEGLARLKAGKMQITSFEDTAFTATVKAEKDSYLYTSVPMEREGAWTVLLDGEKAEVVPFTGAFVGIYVPAGEHTLEFSYTAEGFLPGLVISLASLILFVALAVFERKRKLFPEKPLPVTVPPAEESAAEGENAVEGEDHDAAEADEPDPQGD